MPLTLPDADEHAMEMQDVHVAQVRVSLVGGEGGGFGRSGSQQQPVASEWGYLAGLRVAAETTPSPEASIPTSERYAQAVYFLPILIVS